MVHPSKLSTRDMAVKYIPTYVRFNVVELISYGYSIFFTNSKMYTILLMFVPTRPCYMLDCCILGAMKHLLMAKMTTTLHKYWYSMTEVCCWDNTIRPLAYKYHILISMQVISV